MDAMTPDMKLLSAVDRRAYFCSAVPLAADK